MNCCGSCTYPNTIICSGMRSATCRTGPMALTGAEFQYNADERDVYEAGGINHYLKRCTDDWAAGWSVDGVQCMVAMGQEKSQLQQILKSIY